MALPVDSYPLSTSDGRQIRLDMVRPETLTRVDFTALAGTAVDTSLVVVNGLYVFYSSEDCVVDFTGVATKTPSASSAVLIVAGERVTCMLTPNAVSMSVIGLANAGALYVQRITNWAGLGFAEALSNG